MPTNTHSTVEISIDSLEQRMQDDWNRRAKEDARFYISCGHRDEDEEAFVRHAEDVVQRVRRDISWLPPGQAESDFRFLEIGCGIGRLITHLARDCGEIHGVDIADEMVREGRSRLAEVPHACLHHAPHSDLRAFADGTFDLVYSYAVFQHLPHVDFVWRYIAESARVLRAGGVLTFQVNTLPIEREECNTWSGVVVTANAVAAVCHANGFRLRTMEGLETQYTWITAQKTSSHSRAISGMAIIDEVRANDGGVDILTARDTIRLVVRFLPAEACDVTELELRAGDHGLVVTRVGVAGSAREREIEAVVPASITPESVDLTLYLRGNPISLPRKVTLAAAPHVEPQILRATDGQELSRDNVSSCGWVKLWLRDWFGDETSFSATLDSQPLYFHLHCDDRRVGAWQVNLRLPQDMAAGPIELLVTLAPPPAKALIVPILVEAESTRSGIASGTVMKSPTNDSERA